MSACAPSRPAVADQVPKDLLDQGLLYPLQPNILETEIQTAARVAKLVFDSGLARVDRPKDMVAFAATLSQLWQGGLGFRNGAATRNPFFMPLLARVEIIEKLISQSFFLPPLARGKRDGKGCFLLASMS